MTRLSQRLPATSRSQDPQGQVSGCVGEMKWGRATPGEETLDATLSFSYVMSRDTCTPRGQGEVLEQDSCRAHWAFHGKSTHSLKIGWSCPAAHHPVYPLQGSNPALVQLSLAIALPLPSPEAQLPRDLDLEVFCDSLEQLEPELVRPSSLSPVLPVPK